MKKHFILFAAAFVLIFAGSVCGEDAALWETDIYALGEDIDGVTVGKVVIGVGTDSHTLLAPPSPPTYSVDMALISPDNIKVTRDIRQSGEVAYRWMIAIDPHGNIPPPRARTATIQWEPSEFGPGDYELREGYDGKGKIVIPDMKTVDSYEVTGGKGQKYFTVTFTP